MGAAGTDSTIARSARLHSLSWVHVSPQCREIRSPASTVSVVAFVLSIPSLSPLARHHARV